MQFQCISAYSSACLKSLTCYLLCASEGNPCSCSAVTVNRRIKAHDFGFGLSVHSTCVQSRRKQPEMWWTGGPPFWFSWSHGTLGICCWSWKNKWVWILINNLIAVSLYSPMATVIDLLLYTFPNEIGDFGKKVSMYLSIRVSRAVCITVIILIRQTFQ